MIWVEGGTFQMGINSGYPDGKPAHKVTLSSFFISKYEITRGQYVKFLNAYGSRIVKESPYQGKLMISLCDQGGVYRENGIWKSEKGYENHPMICVSWYGAWAYCKYYGLRLPTEAEWEYAARGGVKSKGYLYSGGNSIKSIGWGRVNSGKKPHQVGQKAANELGIHDMSGNVFEWCADWYDDKYYQNSPSNNPKGSTKGKFRVARGGSWFSFQEFSQVANRMHMVPHHRGFAYGFRVVYTP